MNSFRYQAVEDSGSAVQGVIDASDRKAALKLLGERGLFPSSLEVCASNGEAAAQVSESVRKGGSLSSAMGEHPRSFSKLYVSMIRVGEEAGVLPKVMSDLANLLEHEDEIRSEVMTAIAYPLFVLGFGIVTVVILL